MMTTAVLTPMSHHPRGSSLALATRIAGLAVLLSLTGCIHLPAEVREQFEPQAAVDNNFLPEPKDDAPTR